MLQRTIFFFQRSIRNKLMVALPIIVGFVLLLMFTLTVFSLRQKVMDQLIERGKSQLSLLAHHGKLRNLDDELAGALTVENILYFQIFDQNGRLLVNRAASEKYLAPPVGTGAILERQKEVLVSKVRYENERVLEFQKETRSGLFIMGLSLAPTRQLLLHQTIILVGIAVLTILTTMIVVISMSHLVSDPLKKLAGEVEGLVEEKPFGKLLSGAEKKDEVGTLARKVNELFQKVSEQTRQITAYKIDSALAKTARQVAHDIRSPLSALQTAIGMLSSLKTEDEKGALNLLELSAKRLTGIADDLLKKHQGEEAGEGVVFSIHHVLDELIGEFGGQEQYKDVRFVKRYDSGAIHIRGDGAKLQRAFGNILKNAAEAMEFSGAITVTTKASEDRASVEIADTGPGMLEEKLQKVLAGGFTEGKDDGHGIGTKVVKETVAEHHGTLRAESTVGYGTTFLIELPRVTQTLPITTFTLRLNPKETVLIVDDEPSLREQWRLILQEQGINTLLCKSYEDVVEQGISPALTPAAIVDYHFNNSEKNGVDVVKYLQSVGFTNLTLCTAEYWKPQLQRESHELGVPICPKPIPKIVVHPHPNLLPEGEGVGTPSLPLPLGKGRGEGKSVQHGYNILVIDDDLGIRMSWDFSREKLNISHLHCYANMEEMQSNGIDLTTIDIAFVDKNIEGSKHSGAEVVNYLKENGIPTVILASGEQADSLKADPAFAKVDHFHGKQIPNSFEKFFRV